MHARRVPCCLPVYVRYPLTSTQGVARRETCMLTHVCKRTYVTVDGRGAPLPDARLCTRVHVQVAVEARLDTPVRTALVQEVVLYMLHVGPQPVALVQLLVQLPPYKATNKVGARDLCIAGRPLDQGRWERQDDELHQLARSAHVVYRYTARPALLCRPQVRYTCVPLDVVRHPQFRRPRLHRAARSRAHSLHAPCRYTHTPADACRIMAPAPPDPSTVSIP